MSLRESVIRLAHEKPHLRADLVPILSKTARDFIIPDIDKDLPPALAKALRAVGEKRDSVGASPETSLSIEPREEGSFVVDVDLGSGAMKRTDLEPHPEMEDMHTRTRNLFRERNKQTFAIAPGHAAISGGTHKGEILTSVYIHPKDYAALQEAKSGKNEVLSSAPKDAMEKWLVGHGIKGSITWAKATPFGVDSGWEASGSSPGNWWATVGVSNSGAHDGWHFRFGIGGHGRATEADALYATYWAGPLEVNAILKTLEAEFLKDAQKAVSTQAKRWAGKWTSAAFVVSGPRAFEAFEGFSIADVAQYMEPRIGTMNLQPKGQGLWESATPAFSLTLRLVPPLRGMPWLEIRGYGRDSSRGRTDFKVLRLEPAGYVAAARRIVKDLGL